MSHAIVVNPNRSVLLVLSILWLSFAVFGLWYAWNMVDPLWTAGQANGRGRFLVKSLESLPVWLRVPLFTLCTIPFLVAGIYGSSIIFGKKPFVVLDQFGATSWGPLGWKIAWSDVQEISIGDVGIVIRGSWKSQNWFLKQPTVSLSPLFADFEITAVIAFLKEKRPDLCEQLD